MCNTTGQESESFVGAKINAAASVIFIILALIASLSVLFGNSLLLAILLRRASLQKIKSLNLLIAELALADFLSVGYWLPFFVFDLLLGYHPVLNEQHCLANGYLVITASVVSVLSLMSISLNRYLHICRPHLFRKVVTRPRTVAWCVACWFISLLLCAPFAERGGFDYCYNHDLHMCYIRKTEGTVSYQNAMVQTLSVVPMLLVAYWSYAIFRQWKTSRMTSDLRSPLLQKLINSSVDAPGRNKIEPSSILVPPISIQSTEVTDHPLSEVEKGPSKQQYKDDLLSVQSATSVCTENKSSTTIESVVSQETGTAQFHSVLQELQKRELRRLAKESEFVRSLLVVCLLMFLSLIPSIIIFSLNAQYRTPEVKISAILTFYFHSAVNWIVYGAMNRSFKREYIKCLVRICCIKRRMFSIT